MLKDVIEDNTEFRFDSDFFQKRFLETIKLIESKPNTRLVHLVSDLKSFGAYSLTNQIDFVGTEGIPFVRCLNIKNGQVNFNNVLYIDAKSNDLLWKSEIKPKMVLVTMSGTIGNATVALEHWKYPINSNQDIAKIEVSVVNPYFLATFLNTHYGYLQMIRLQAGAVQQHLYLSQIEKLRIPDFSPYFQLRIESVFKAAYKTQELSATAYTTAENLLLSALGLDADTLAELQAPSQMVNANVKSFADSFLSLGRLDSEFYQTKYDRMVNWLEENVIEVSPFNDVIKALDNGTEIRDYVEEEGTRYLRVTDLSKDEINNNSPKFVVKQAPPRRLQLNKDCLLIARSGTLGLVNIATDDIFDAILSSHIFRVEIDTSIVSPIFLETYFRSGIGQELLIQQNNGGVVPEINHEGLRRVPIPILARDEMKAITNELLKLRTDAKRLKDRATSLLEIANHVVEVAIEEGEEQAITLLESQDY